MNNMFSSCIGAVLGERYHIIDGRKVFLTNYILKVDPYVYYKYCAICKCIKPPRAHHCRLDHHRISYYHHIFSVTGRCIYNMDHFCPW